MNVRHDQPHMKSFFVHQLVAWLHRVGSGFRCGHLDRHRPLPDAIGAQQLDSQAKRHRMTVAILEAARRDSQVLQSIDMVGATAKSSATSTRRMRSDMMDVSTTNRRRSLLIAVGRSALALT